MKFTFVRHGETDYNKERRAMGSTIDRSLNKRGREQARETAQALNTSPDLILSSPLKRAHETAEIIGDILSVSVNVDERLQERSYGSLAGKSWEEVEEATGRPIASQEFDFKKWGGESANDVRGRLREFVEDVRKEYPGKSLLVVCHGGVIKQFYFVVGVRNDSHVAHGALHEFEL